MKPLHVTLATLATVVVGTLVVPALIALMAKGLLFLFNEPVKVLVGMGLFGLGYLTAKLVK